MTSEMILQGIVNGLIMGAIYILIATRVNPFYGIMHIVNFAHGEVYMLGAFACSFWSTSLGLATLYLYL